MTRTDRLRELERAEKWYVPAREGQYDLSRLTVDELKTLEAILMKAEIRDDQDNKA